MCQIAMISMHTCPLESPGGPKAGGMNVCVRELARQLARQEMQLDVYTRQVYPYDEAVTDFEQGARLIRLPAGPWGPLDKQGLFDALPEFTAGLRAFAEREGKAYILIHAHYWLSGWSAIQLKETWGTPVVQSFHTLGQVKNLAAQPGEETEPSLRIEHERQVIQRADRVIVATEVEREQVISLYDADPEKLRTVPCGVDTELFRPIPRAEARRVVGVSPEDKVALFVGRLEQQKGLDVLFPALARIHQQVGHPLTFLIIGGDRRREAQKLEQLRQRAEELGISCHVRLPGLIEQRCLPYYYSAADVCAMPSYAESFGMVAVEAMACGTPIVASRVGGLQLTVRDGVTGYLVPPRDVESLAERMIQILRDPALRDRLGAAGIERAQEYSWQTIATGLRQVYEELRPCNHEKKA